MLLKMPKCYPTEKFRLALLSFDNFTGQKNAPRHEVLGSLNLLLTESFFVQNPELKKKLKASSRMISRKKNSFMSITDFLCALY
jgi:hypothetical protein